MKTCTTPNCNNKVFSKNLCVYHWKGVYGKAIMSNMTKTCIAKPKNKYQDKRKLNEFFGEMVNRIPEACACGRKWGFIAPHLRRWYCAHILPKAYFKSVETDEDNIMFLNPFDCCCHPNWDNRNAADRVKMDCYPQAIKQFQKFSHKLTEAEYIRAIDYLNIKV